jgi:hypothetical protein
MTSLDELAAGVLVGIECLTPDHDHHRDLAETDLDSLLTRAKYAETAYFDVRGELAKERDDHAETRGSAEQLRHERDKAQEQAIAAGRYRYQAERDRDRLKEAVRAFGDMGLARRDWTEHVGNHDGASEQEMNGFDRCTNCGKVNVHWPECAINVNARHGCTCVASNGARPFHSDTEEGN